MPDDVKLRECPREDVERVARAMCDAEGVNPDGVNSFTGKPRWQNYRVLALAAINAMKGANP